MRKTGWFVLVLAAAAAGYMGGSLTSPQPVAGQDAKEPTASPATGRESSWQDEGLSWKVDDGLLTLSAPKGGKLSYLVLPAMSSTSGGKSTLTLAGSRYLVPGSRAILPTDTQFSIFQVMPMSASCKGKGCGECEPVAGLDTRVSNSGAAGQIGPAPFPFDCKSGTCNCPPPPEIGLSSQTETMEDRFGENVTQCPIVTTDEVCEDGIDNDCDVSTPDSKSEGCRERQPVTG